jgi:hypothetical protein
MDIDYSQDSSDEGDLYASFVNTQKQQQHQPLANATPVAAKLNKPI